MAIVKNNPTPYSNLCNISRCIRPVPGSTTASRTAVKTSIFPRRLDTWAIYDTFNHKYYIYIHRESMTFNIWNGVFYHANYWATDINQSTSIDQMY